MQYVSVALQCEEAFSYNILISLFGSPGLTSRAPTPPLCTPLLRMKVTSKFGRFHCIIWDNLGAQ